MNKKNRWLKISALLFLLAATYSKPCPVIIENDTEAACTVQDLEENRPSEIINVGAGQNIEFGQKGTHAHFRIKQELTADDGTSIHKEAELQQTNCSKDNKPIIISVKALFAEQRDPMLPLLELFEVFYPEPE